MDPAFRRRGVGTALYRALEAQLIAQGRNRFDSWTLSRSIGESADSIPAEQVVRPGSGVGFLSTQVEGVAFARALGFTLGQVERQSVAALPIAPEELAELAEEAAQVEEGEYQLISWRDTAPEEYLEQYAYCEQRMSTDAPQGDLEIEETRVDGARMRDAEERAKRFGIQTVATAAIHRATGVMAGYTKLDWLPEHPDALTQGATIVLPEHRGKRLGQWIKAHNLKEAQDRWSGQKRVYTWNALENEYMLSINNRFDFRTFAFEGAWQKKV